MGLAQEHPNLDTQGFLNYFEHKLCPELGCNFE
jgi:hypothetical protein